MSTSIKDSVSGSPISHSDELNAVLDRFPVSRIFHINVDSSIRIFGRSSMIYGRVRAESRTVRGGPLIHRGAIASGCAALQRKPRQFIRQVLIVLV